MGMASLNIVGLLTSSGVIVKKKEAGPNRLAVAMALAYMLGSISDPVTEQLVPYEMTGVAMRSTSLHMLLLFVLF